MLRTLTPLVRRAFVMETPSNKVPIPRNGVDYRGKVVLAPMVRSGELPSRLLALKYGADLVWGPETIDRAIIGTTRRVCERTNTVTWSRYSSSLTELREKDPNANCKESIIYRLHPQLEGKKLIYQMGSADPKLAVEAAKLVAADVAGIDLNSGCPKPFSTCGGMGAALLKTPDRLCAILEALVTEIGAVYEIGISVKIRILADPKDTEALVRRLVKTGITGLTVHCRTTPMRPRERAIRSQMSMIADICREAGVACLINGDVEDRDHAMALMKEFGVDGAMIATSAEKNPSVFRSKADGGSAPWEERVRSYLDYAMAVENRWGNTKFTLAQICPAKAVDIPQCKDHEDVIQRLGWDDLLDRAKEVDSILGMQNRIDKKAEKRAKVAENIAKNAPKKSKPVGPSEDLNDMSSDMLQGGMTAIAV